MPFRFSRRGFFGGLFAALFAAFRTPRTPAAVSPPAPTPPEAVPPTAGGFASYSYDSQTGMTIFTDPAGCVTTLTYDASIPLSTAGGTVTTYSYDAVGRPPSRPGTGLV
jgi:hypothetical protein